MFASKRVCYLVVLSGSAVHTMQALESGGSPLFGRLDWRHQLRPFVYYDAGRMVEYGMRHKVLTYAAFGGTPQHLASIDSSRPLSDNIVQPLVTPSGRVRIARWWNGSQGTYTEKVDLREPRHTLGDQLPARPHDNLDQRLPPR